MSHNRKPVFLRLEKLVCDAGPGGVDMSSEEKVRPYLKVLRIPYSRWDKMVVRLIDTWDKKGLLFRHADGRRIFYHYLHLTYVTEPIRRARRED